MAQQPFASPTPPASADAPAPMTLGDFLDTEAEKRGIPRALARAITRQESAGRQAAVSPKGATGFMQLMPGTAAELGGDPSDPFQNITMGLDYFKQQLDTHKGDVRLALAAYNAGPGRTRNGRVPEIAETQDYVTRILTAWQGGGDPAQAAAPQAVTAQPPATPLPPGASAGMMPPSTAADTVDTPYRTPAEREAVLSKEALSTITRLGLDIAAFTAAGRAATALIRGPQLAARLLQAGVSAGRVKAVVASANAAAQAAAAGTVAAAKGDSDPEFTAALAAASPIAGGLITSMGPAIRRAAVTRAARFLERGNVGVVTENQEQWILQAAKDIIDIPVQRTWRETSRMLGRRTRQAGTALRAAKAGAEGDILVPYTAVRDQLVGLAEDVQRLRPVKGDHPLGGYQFKSLRPEINSAVDDLVKYMDDHFAGYQGGLVPARDLHDVKAVWWKTIYSGKSTAGLPTSTKDMLTSAQKEAHMRGATAIMDALATTDLRRLDEAVTHASRLQKIVQGVERVGKSGGLIRPETRSALGAAGAAVGSVVGGAAGYPLGGVISAGAGVGIGAQVGFATARLLSRAVQTPRWKLLPSVRRRAIADAILRGDAETVRNIVTPLILAETANEDNLMNQPQSSSPSAH